MKMSNNWPLRKQNNGDISSEGRQTKANRERLGTHTTTAFMGLERLYHRMTSTMEISMDNDGIQPRKLFNFFRTWIKLVWNQ
jgi:hypothetical protein